MGLRLSKTILEAIRGWAREAYPVEGCGLLIGRQGAAVEVVRAVAARNVRGEPDRYEVDPLDHLAAHRSARAEGLDVVGVWHSHPDSAPRPSETDRATAWEGWSYLIVAVGSEGAGEARSWRLDGGGAFQEEDIRP